MKALGLGLVILCLAAGVAGADSATAVAAYKAGQQRYVDGDYEGAALQFKAAYAADPDPVYLFNVGQAFRQAKQCAQAAAYYRYYLGSVERAPNEAAVKTYIDEVDACALQQPAVEVDPAPAKPRPPVVPIELLPPPEPAITAPVDRPVSDDPGRSRRLIGIGAAGLGLAVVATGFYFMYQVGQDESDRNGLCRAPCTWSDPLTKRARAIDDAGDRHEKYMTVSFIAGGAALAGGIVLYLTGRRSPEQARVAITPTGTGAMVSVKF